MARGDAADAPRERRVERRQAQRACAVKMMAALRCAGAPAAACAARGDARVRL